MRWSVVALLMVVAFAGCTETGGNTEAQGTNQTQDNGIDVGDGRVTLQATTASTEVVTITDRAASPDTSVCVEGCDYNVYSLTDAMHPDTAYFMDAVMTWEFENVEGSPYFQLGYESGVRDYSGAEYDYSGTPARGTMTATLLAPGPSPVLLNVGGNIEAPDYELTVTLTPVIDSVPQYAPVAVAVPQGGSLVVESQNGDGGVMVIDEDGALVDLVELKGNAPGQQKVRDTVLHRVPGAQEYVLFAKNDLWTKVFVVQDEGMDSVPRLRHLPLYWGEGEPQAMQDSGEFTQQVDTQPFRARLRIGNVDGSGLSEPFVVQNGDFTLTGPDGGQVFSLSGYNCYCTGQSTYHSSWDADGLTPGEFLMEFSRERGEGGQVRVDTLHYVQ